jgi:hypothetical protein
MARLAGEDWGKLSRQCKLQQACTYQTSKIGFRTVCPLHSLQFLCRYQKELDRPVCGSTDTTQYLCKRSKLFGLFRIGSPRIVAAFFRCSKATYVQEYERRRSDVRDDLLSWVYQPIFRNFSHLTRVSSRDIRVYPVCMARGREGLES